ncbi:hydrolase [Paenibacillus tritici]|uniref:alanyl-tRNA editing protein n=1 Tax=Paenibacillus tritici TaxID=1873425 RepID=UPI001BA9E149|nr:DHHA1 domain-containing protein [Paenibacillus tritici]QUL57827.1 hydrolase [Paenibacillus tritici]
MTTKLYYDSAYVNEWSTTITSTLQREDGIYVTLAETAFYPHGGGQPCDTGTIGGIAVLDVVLEDQEVLHKVAELPVQMEVRCKLDWSRRFDHMQQHSGQHLLSAVFRERYQAMTLSFHLGSDYATIDLAMPELSAAQMAEAEQEVNRQIYLNRPVTSYFVTAEEMARLPLVKLPKVTEDIRIVEIEGVEHNACGGTHVSSTGAIGMVKLLRSEKQKGNIRITFQCGSRALNEFNNSLQILSKLSVKFNTGKDEIVDRIEKWEQEQKQLQIELAAMKELNDSYLARELLSSMEAGCQVITHISDTRPLKDLQSLAANLTALTELPVLLLTAVENKVVLAHHGAAALSCGAFFKAHLNEYHGKGGGSDKLAQAGFPSWEAAQAFYDFARQQF